MGVTPPSYADAIAAVRRRHRVTLKLLTRDLGIEYPRVQGYLEQMEKEGIVSPVAADGWREVLSPFDDADDGNADAGSWREQRIAELEAQVARLKASGRTVIAQREEWKARALAAEGKIAGAADARYAAVKRLLARELHPDAATDAIGRTLREALFKQLWPQIEALERGEG